MKKIIAFWSLVSLVAFLTLIAFGVMAQEKDIRSITLTAPSNSVLIYTNVYEPNILYSIGLSFASAVTGNVSVSSVRSNFYYEIGSFTMAGHTNLIIECKRNWALNDGDTIEVDVTNTGNSAQTVINSWR